MKVEVSIRPRRMSHPRSSPREASGSRSSARSQTTCRSAHNRAEKDRGFASRKPWTSRAGRYAARPSASTTLAQTMLQLVNAGHKSLADYATIATRGLMDEIRQLAEPLAGKRVVHLSATAFGGGVAEINYTLVPLMQDAGLEVEWRIIRGADDFFNVTKTIHNAIQGDPHGLSDSHKEIFGRYQEMNARDFTDDYDFVIVHDPQPVGLIEHFPESKAHWVWRA